MNSIFKGKGIIVGYTAALLLAAGLAFALSALPPGAGRERQEAAAAAKYKEALALMDGGSMDEALGLLEELPYGYRDVYPLTAYIEALRLYEAGEDPYYYDVISRLSHISEDYPGEYSAQISALRRQARDNFGREAARRRAADPMPTPSPTPCFRPTSPASAGSGPDDPYNAADFTGPEDFYEENRDAFDNIDDAEAYWQENS
ncbi:MAG: hypothetical protein Q4C92_07555 [Clostridia bacterium]|nr:hypothetical protein [Clostridia bacterium]